jgi:hypothetical protein
LRGRRARVVNSTVAQQDVLGLERSTNAARLPLFVRSSTRLLVLSVESLLGVERRIDTIPTVDIFSLRQERIRLARFDRTNGAFQQRFICIRSGNEYETRGNACVEVDIGG